MNESKTEVKAACCKHCRNRGFVTREDVGRLGLSYADNLNAYCPAAGKFVKRCAPACDKFQGKK